MQRRKQGGILPIGAEVQVLQPRVLQADVLQDVPRTLTLREAKTDAGKERRERKADQRRARRRPRSLSLRRPCGTLTTAQRCADNLCFIFTSVKWECIK